MSKLILIFFLLVPLTLQASQKMFRFPIKSVPESIDPHQLYSLFAVIVGNQIHKSLFKFSPALELEKSLASAYRFTNSGLSLTVELGDYQFSDGTPLKPEHVVNSFKRLFFIQSSMCADMDYLLNSSEAMKGEADKLGIRKVGERSIEFSLAKKNYLVLYHLATLDTAILKLSHWKDKPNLDIGLGHYKVIKHEKESIELKNVAPAADKINQFKYIKVSADEVYKESKSGKLEAIEGYYLNPEEIIELKADKWNEYPSTIVRQFFLVLNPDLVSANVRKHFQRAVLEHPLANKFNLGTVKKMYGVVPNSIPGSLNKQDVEFLIKDKLVPLSKEHRLKVAIQKSEAFAKSLMEDLALALKKAKIILEVEELEVEMYAELFYKKSVPVYLSSKFLDYPDAYSILSYFKTTDVKDSFFSNDSKINHLLDTATTESDVMKRSEIFRQAQKIILAKNNVVPFISGSEQIGLWSNEISYVPAHPMGFHTLQLDDVRVKKK